MIPREPARPGRFRPCGPRRDESLQESNRQGLGPLRANRGEWLRRLRGRERRMNWTRWLGPPLAVAVIAPAALASDPWADHVVSYVPGTGISMGYDKFATALGSPERFTGEGSFPGCVTPFNPAFLADEIVGVGTGGSLVLSFDEPIRNDSGNAFGNDLIVFGNAAFIDLDFPHGVAGPLFSASTGGLVEVSADGQTWFPVPGVQPVGLFPTLGYSDLTDPYALSPGAVPSDFTRPVDPTFNPAGRTFAEIAAAYAGSGGGAGVDIAASGLSEVSFVRISNSAGAFYIDAVSAVPSPGAYAPLTVFAILASRRKRVA